ncbi:unnamed protein product [Rotaria magnacalcarata]|uniref:SWIM-type domain-containing protein n=1 Tax=Rotaria magnacalcarata TaxID=392030 RepID=A0A818YM71_9BILA|nr:unnamed protein product [Rotaria magnacalcarata]
MNERCCPCGARLDRSSCVRPLKSPCLRMFMPIRTLKSLSSDQKVCNACRHSYIKWKSENSEFSAMLDHFENDMVVINDDANSDSVQTDDSSCLTTVENPTLITTTNHQVVKLQLNATSSSHRKCCVCRENLRDHAVKITSQDRDFIFFSRNIWIPEGVRCCSGHLINNLLSKEAVDQIKPFSIRYQELSSSDFRCFDDPRDLNDDEYCLLTSLSRDNFDDFVQIISSSTIRPSCNRSIRTAVGIYLCKLRLGISNRLLACIFQIADKQTVSRIINSARQAIVKSFVLGNLGFGLVAREDVIGRHTTTIARELMCGGDSTDTAIIIIDGTYLYIQTSRNNEFRRKIFNLYKKRSLLKPMMIVTTTGVFQLKRARSYAEERWSTTNLTGDVAYSVHRCKIIPNLIRIPTQSAHSNRVTYHSTIHFTNQAILGWWCDCFTGARFLGCCSHIASAIWFLSYQQWQAQQRHMSSDEYKNLATDSIQVSDFYVSSDDDDSQRYTLT